MKIIEIIPILFELKLFKFYADLNWFTESTAKNDYFFQHTHKGNFT